MEAQTWKQIRGDSLDGTVKVLDLGLARLEQADGESLSDNLTASGSLMGTVDNMAPKQALDSRRADARSDIYSLGCTLFFLITGRPLFGGDTFMKKVLAHCSESATSMGEASASVSIDLEAACQSMVAKDPAERPHTMAEVIAILEACLKSMPTVDGTSDTDDKAASAPFAATHIGETPVHSALSATVIGSASKLDAAAATSPQGSRRFAQVLKSVKWLWGTHMGRERISETLASTLCLSPASSIVSSSDHFASGISSLHENENHEFIQQWTFCDAVLW